MAGKRDTTTNLGDGWTVVSAHYGRSGNDCRWHASQRLGGYDVRCKAFSSKRAAFAWVATERLTAAPELPAEKKASQDRNRGRFSTAR